MLRIGLVLIAALVLVPPVPARASFPGANGPFVVSIGECWERGSLAKIPWRGGELTRLTEGCEYSTPEASPDGRTLLALRIEEFCCPEFVTMDADGTDVTPVPLPEEDVTPRPSAPSFAPDGRTFAFEGDKPLNGFESASLWAVSTDGTERRRIEEGFPCPGGDEPCPVYENPSWSPDGELIAVTVNYIDEPGLWLIRARDGTPVRRIAGSRAFEPDWSPDGRRIVFRTAYDRTYRRTLGGNLYVVSRDGQRRRTLVHRENIAETAPTWSPNGRWIAWVSVKLCCGDETETVTQALWRVRAKGGEPQRIQRLPEPYVEEGAFLATHLTWLPR
jgi:Tol biopolymer transport system component